MAAELQTRRLAAAIAALLVAGASEVAAQSARNVLIVANRESEVSETVATYYASRRGVPAEQILRLTLPLEDEISREIYARAIETPIARWLTVNTAQDRILYLVLTKGVPLRIAGTAGQQGTVASVDSELSLLYRRLSGVATSATGPIPNPYFGGSSGVTGIQPFSHRTHDIYLVTRFDGYTLKDVQALIDRGLEPSRDGSILLDGRTERLPSVGNRWLAAAAEKLEAFEGWETRVRHDDSGVVLRGESNVLGYYSWGSNDRTEGTRRLEHQFNPGALAALFVSTDARTFEEPPAEWTVNGRPFRGSHQSLTGDLIREGITGVAGHVAEPYLSATVRPDILFPAYVSGFNLAESFYGALPSLSWQTVVVGDPLVAPFRKTAVADRDLDPPVDQDTELPAFLSERRVASLMATGVGAQAARLMARVEVRGVRGDSQGVRDALERAVKADPSFVDARMALATIHEAASEWQPAVEQYKEVIRLAPEHSNALNNLAYALATRLDQPADALPFAIRAFQASKADASVTDTLAWVYHLLGQDLEAEPLIVGATNLAPGSAVIHWHAAVILQARGKLEMARLALDRALAINPALADASEIQAFRSKLE